MECICQCQAYFAIFLHMPEQLSSSTAVFCSTLCKLGFFSLLNLCWDVRGSGGIAPYILDLGNRWMWVVGFIPRLIYLLGKPHATLDGRLEWTLWRSEQFLPVPRNKLRSSSGKPAWLIFITNTLIEVGCQISEITICLFLVALRANAGHGRLMHEVSWSHTTTRHSR
jgi:hypothetical protein